MQCITLNTPPPFVPPHWVWEEVSTALSRGRASCQPGTEEGSDNIVGINVGCILTLCCQHIVGNTLLYSFGSQNDIGICSPVTIKKTMEKMLDYNSFFKSCKRKSCRWGLKYNQIQVDFVALCGNHTLKLGLVITQDSQSEGLRGVKEGKNCLNPAWNFPDFLGCQKDSGGKRAHIQMYRVWQCPAPNDCTALKERVLTRAIILCWQRGIDGAQKSERICQKLKWSQRD